ncbi:hypothetical protein [Actinocrispum wychmicini]|uniref:hypothetical protein n=1 Tax=Actinocrispum wychmicini TaxID=1213861 RepID=UPI00140481C4|nr:hypothetical protein [Actinocrispum wychmicini]
MDVFATHFPRFPVQPGVLLLDDMVEVARLAVGVDWMLTGADKVRYRRFARPGDEVDIEIETGTHRGRLAGVFPPTGRVLRLTELVLVRIDHSGRLVSLWQESDFYGALVQAGVLAPPGASKPRQARTALRNAVRAARSRIQPRTAGSL